MIDISKLNFEKLNGLVPAVVVDKNTDAVFFITKVYTRIIPSQNVLRLLSDETQ